ATSEALPSATCAAERPACACATTACCASIACGVEPACANDKLFCAVWKVDSAPVSVVIAAPTSVRAVETFILYPASTDAVIVEFGVASLTASAMASRYD